MKQKSIFCKLLFLSLFLLINIFSCPNPSGNVPTPTPLNLSVYPYMVVAENKIYNTSITQEYSLNNKDTFSDCGGGIVSVTFRVGDRVWVREKSNPSQEWYLGEVKALSGYADLFPSTRFCLSYYNSSDGQYYESYSFVANQKVRIYYKYFNIGAAVDPKSFNISFYLSSDQFITSSDTLLVTLANSNLAQGLLPTTDESYYVSSANFYIPANLTPGIYYLGYILDTNGSIQELNDDNNTTSPAMVKQIIIKDPSPNTQGGAFKIVNSWGTTGNWEKIKDGHCWITYQTAKTLKLPIYYFYNNSSVQYRPTVIAVFKIAHPQRNKCLIKIGLGNPATTQLVKEFQARSGSVILSGAWPFPDNKLALDISEFANSVNSTNVFISITNSSTDQGTLESFEIKYFSVLNGELLHTVAGTGGPFGGSGATSLFTANTSGALNPEYLDDIIPLPRSVYPSITFIEDFPTADELALDMAVLGVYQPNRNYNKLVDGQYGTGYVPPTIEEWSKIKKLRGLETDLLRSTGLNQKIDHSATKYFPPIGNQGSEGSCTCFAVAYYAHTYATAKEFNWDLSQTVYGGAWPGEPLSNKDKIMSPDFVYHQINYGVDNGSSPHIAITLLARMGCATWQTMPYNCNDYKSWPAEQAFMEAAKYRASEISRLNGYQYYGYFIIRDDSDINLLKQLLLWGYVVTTAIDADLTSDGLYYYLDNKDVVDLSFYPVGYEINHAQAIVGFKDGTSWDPANPDN